MEKKLAVKGFLLSIVTQLNESIKMRINSGYSNLKKVNKGKRNKNSSLNYGNFFQISFISKKAKSVAQNSFSF